MVTLPVNVADAPTILVTYAVTTPIDSRPVTIPRVDTPVTTNESATTFAVLARPVIVTLPVELSTEILSPAVIEVTIPDNSVPLP